MLFTQTFDFALDGIVPALKVAHTTVTTAYDIYKLHKFMWRDGKAEMTTVHNFYEKRKLKQKLNKTVEVTHNHDHFLIKSGQRVELDTKLKSGDIVRIEDEVSESLKKKILKKIFGYCEMRNFRKMILLLDPTKFKTG